jgi:hypothetical protein
VHVFIGLGVMVDRGYAHTAQLHSLAAYRRCASLYERANPASRGQPLQGPFERGACIVFLCAHLAVRTP